MQATIYVTQDAFDTAQTVKDLDNYDRSNLCDEVPGLAYRAGYHLKNANMLNLAVLPETANVAYRIVPTEVGQFDIGSPQLSVPANLRGCIFERAPDLPVGYADIVPYWSGETLNANTSGAVYYQCPLNAYMVDLGPDAVYAPVVNDRLLSEGIVVAINGLDNMLHGVLPEDFIEVLVPVDANMLGNEPEAFQSDAEYGLTTERFEQVFLKVADILASPDPDRIFIDLLCNELIDYGYWY